MIEVLPMSEDQLLQAVTDALSLFGWRWTHPRRSDKALTMGHVGFPDIVAVRPPRLLFIELKATNGRVSPDQLLWIAALGGAALEVSILRPEGLDRFLEDIR